MEEKTDTMLLQWLSSAVRDRLMEESKEAAARANRKAFDEALEVVRNTKNPPVIPKNSGYITLLSEADWEILSAEEQKKLFERLLEKAHNYFPCLKFMALGTKKEVIHGNSE